MISSRLQRDAGSGDDGVALASLAIKAQLRSHPPFQFEVKQPHRLKISQSKELSRSSAAFPRYIGA